MATGSIVVRGSTADRRAEIRKAARWILSHFVGARRTAHIRLSIRFSSRIEREGLRGECAWTDCNVMPREFTILIATSLSLRLQLLTLAHELTHVKQYVTGTIFDFSRHSHLTRWKHRVVNTNRVAYKNFPWEREALKLEHPTIKAYKASLKIL